MALLAGELVAGLPSKGSFEAIGGPCEISSSSWLAARFAQNLTGTSANFALSQRHLHH